MPYDPEIDGILAQRPGASSAASTTSTPTAATTQAPDADVDALLKQRPKAGIPLSSLIAGIAPTVLSRVTPAGMAMDFGGAALKALGKKALGAGEIVRGLFQTPPDKTALDPELEAAMGGSEGTSGTTSGSLEGNQDLNPNGTPMTLQQRIQRDASVLGVNPDENPTLAARAGNFGGNAVPYLAAAPESLIARVLTNVALGAGDTTLSGGSPTEAATAGIVGGAIPAVGAGTAEVGKAISPALYNALLGTSKRSFQFGRTPGAAVADEGIAALTKQGLANKIGGSVDAYTQQLEDLVNAAPHQPVGTVGQAVAPARAMVPFQQQFGANPGAAAAVQDVADRVVAGPVPPSTLTPGQMALRESAELSPTGALAMKRAIGNQGMTWSPASLEQAVPQARANIYDELSRMVENAVPGAEPLNQKLSNLITAKELASDAAANDKFKLSELVDPFKLFGLRRLADSPAVTTGLVQGLRNAPVVANSATGRAASELINLAGQPTASPVDQAPDAEMLRQLVGQVRPLDVDTLRQAVAQMQNRQSAPVSPDSATEWQPGMVARMPAKATSTPTAAPAAGPTPADVAFGAKTAIGEAEGEGLEGQRAVLHAIANRLAQHPGATVQSIVQAPRQFDSWAANNPRRSVMDSLDLSDPQYAKLVDLAQRVLAGQDADNTGGANLFFNPDQASPSWARRARPTVKIGQHQFLVE